jgi:hypothetical protein
LVLVPVTPPLEVVKVQGSYLIQKVNSDLGNNAYEATTKNFIDPVSLEARKNNDGLDGLFPLITQNPFDSSPWDYWDPATNINHTRGLQTNPDMTAEKGKRYIDSVLTFFAPRACVALNLGCDLRRFLVGTHNPTSEEIGLSVVPMPATDRVLLSVQNSFSILSVSLFDINGQLVTSMKGNGLHKMEVSRNTLASGFYLAKLELNDGAQVSGKVIFK